MRVARPGALTPLDLPPLAEKPLVSVLVSNYNYAQYLGQAIESALEQTYPRFELMVCDDGSTDGSRDVVEAYQRSDARVRLIAKQNGGQASGFNAAYQASRGEILCLLDSDDLYHRNKLERVVAAFQQNREAGMVLHRVLRVDARRKPRGVMPLFTSIPRGWQGENALRNGGILEDLPPCSALSLRREVAQRIFPLPTCFTHHGDAFLMRIAPLVTCICSMDDALAEWRRHGKNNGNVQRIDEGFIDRELTTYVRLWSEQRRYLEIHAPAAAGLLRPLETSRHVAEMRYVRARLTSDGSEARRSYVALRESPEAQPWAREWFWRVSRRFPRFVFRLALNQFWTDSGWKRIASTLAQIGKVNPRFDIRHQQGDASL